MITQTVKTYWQGWIRKRNPKGNPQTVDSKNIYILPSGFGWAYALVILIIFIVAINYQINTIFLMTFLLIIIGLVSAFEAHGNLKNLSIKLLTVDDAQQGTPAKMILYIHANNTTRFGFEFNIASQPKLRLEKIPPQGMQFIMPIETTKRGYFPVPPIVISNLYPFGIFRVWSYAYFEDYYYVYPEPIDPGFWPEACSQQNLKTKYMQGDEEFYDLKQVENPWVDPKHIYWRIVAKGQGWYLKTMNTNEVDYWLFNLKDLPANDLESKLKNLSYWLQTAEAKGLIYALELPTIHTKFSRGREHLRYCLRQLALYS